MKAIVFTEFLERVEARYWPAFLKHFDETADIVRDLRNGPMTQVRFKIFKSGG